MGEKKWKVEANEERPCSQPCNTIYSKLNGRFAVHTERPSSTLYCWLLAYKLAKSVFEHKDCFDKYGRTHPLSSGQS